MHERRADPQGDLSLLVAPFDRWVFYPVARTVFRAMPGVPLTPNQITVIHLLLGLSTFWWLAKPSGPSPHIAVGVYLLRCVLDCLDGVVARARNVTSPMGRTLDEWSDAVSATALISGAAVAAWRIVPDPWMPVLAVIAVIAAAILALQNELCRRRFVHALERGEDRVLSDYADVRRRRFSSAGAWLGHLADASKLRLNGITLNPARLAAEARFISARAGSREQHRHLRYVSIGAGDNAILVLVAFVAAQQYAAGLVATIAYSLLMSATTFLLTRRYLSQAPAASTR